jgi:cation transport ATPase
MENTLNLAIEGMHCGACVRRVTTALQGIEGVTVKSVEVGSAKVAFDVVLDKTGTITAGRPEVTDLLLTGSPDERQAMYDELLEMIYKNAR